MLLSEKKFNYLNRIGEPTKERVFGRYNSSELGSIIKKYKSAINHFKVDHIQNSERFPNQVDTVLTGMFIEDGYNKMFKNDCKCGDKQSKYEYKINDEITIVVKPDFEWEDRVWEMKCPVEPVYEIPKKWKYQLEMEYRATLKDVYLFVVMVGNGKLVETLIPYTPSDETFNEIKTNIIRYHELIKKYQKK